MLALPGNHGRAGHRPDRVSARCSLIIESKSGSASGPAGQPIQCGTERPALDQPRRHRFGDLADECRSFMSRHSVKRGHHVCDRDDHRLRAAHRAALHEHKQEGKTASRQRAVPTVTCPAVGAASVSRWLGGGGGGD